MEVIPTIRIAIVGLVVEAQRDKFSIRVNLYELNVMSNFMNFKGNCINLNIYITTCTKRSNTLKPFTLIGSRSANEEKQEKGEEREGNNIMNDRKFLVIQ